MHLRSVCLGDSHPPSFKQDFMGINTLILPGCGWKTTECSLGVLHPATSKKTLGGKHEAHGLWLGDTLLVCTAWS